MKKFAFNWGFGIAVVYSVFALSTLGFVAFAMTQRVDLVQEDYYEQSLQHDETMLARSHAQELGTQASIAYSNGSVDILIPAEQVAGVKGNITLYRASQLDSDRKIDLSVNSSGEMHIPTNGLVAGPWRVTLHWTFANKQYELQRNVMIE